MSPQKSTKKIYFVSHGLCKLNVEGLFAGHTETPLVAEGRQQAELAGEQAKTLDIDYIISSPMGRCTETAKIIAKAIGYPEDKIHIDPLFIERNCGDKERTTYIHGYDFSTVPNAEDDNMLKARAAKAVKVLDSIDAQNILVVSHGGIGRAIRFHLKPEVSFLQQIKNGHIEEWV